jgi:hypothetical protein
MKKITILVAIILVGFVAQASANSSNDDGKKASRFDENQPIEFNERGIQFYVFANGEFDFNTRPDDNQGGYYYKTAGRRNNISDCGPKNYGVLIENDSFGRVRRIGNTFINYDFNDRVSRIGSVYMRYNRFALIQIGGLQLVYNRFGELIDRFGSVKGRRGFGFSYGVNAYNENNNNGCNENNNGYYGTNNHNNNNYSGYNSGNNNNYYYKNSNKPANDSLKSNNGSRRN